MPVLVDGDNLLGTWGRPRTDAERRELALELDRWARDAGKQVRLVFDGARPEGLAFGPDVRFAGRHHQADDLILRTLQRQREPAGWQVITSDRSLGDRCRWLGARVQRCDRFRRRLTRSSGEEKPEGVDDLDYWLEIFGEDDRP